MLAVLLLFSLPSGADLIVRGYSAETAARYDRFYPDGGETFLGFGYDWSGVGRSDNGRWGVMVSETCFLTAYHYPPSGTLSFYPDNTLGSAVTHTVDSLVRIGETDLAVGWLDTPLDPADGICFYPILWADSLESYLGTVLYNVGQPFRVGRNVVEDFALVSLSGSTALSMLYDYDNHDVPPVGGDETFLQSGDSGGPSFAAVGDALGLCGIHWFIYSADGEVGSGDSFVPAYVAEIGAALGEPLHLLPIPEPGTGLLLLAAGLALSRRPPRRAPLRAPPGAGSPASGHRPAPVCPTAGRG